MTPLLANSWDLDPVLSDSAPAFSTIILKKVKI